MEYSWTHDEGGSDAETEGLRPLGVPGMFCAADIGSRRLRLIQTDMG